MHVQTTKNAVKYSQLHIPDVVVGEKHRNNGCGTFIQQQDQRLTALRRLGI